MYRSDRIYLSKFALDPDPEYLDLNEFDLDDETGNDAYYEKFISDDKKNYQKKSGGTGQMKIRALGGKSQ